MPPGARTAIFTGKPKFHLYDDSYDAARGAEDALPPDHGRDKIDQSLASARAKAENDGKRRQVEKLANAVVGEKEERMARVGAGDMGTEHHVPARDP